MWWYDVDTIRLARTNDFVPRAPKTQMSSGRSTTLRSPSEGEGREKSTPMSQWLDVQKDEWIIFIHILSVPLCVDGIYNSGLREQWARRYGLLNVKFRNKNNILVIVTGNFHNTIALMLLLNVTLKKEIVSLRYARTDERVCIWSQTFLIHTHERRIMANNLFKKIIIKTI